MTLGKKLLILYLIAINIFQIVQMGDDKHRVENQQFRIAEAQLLTVNWVGAPAVLYALGALVVWFVVIRFVYRKRKYLV